PVTGRPRRAVEDVAPRQDLDVVLPLDREPSGGDETPVRGVAPSGGVAASLAHAHAREHEIRHPPFVDADLTGPELVRREHGRDGRADGARRRLETPRAKAHGSDV